MAEEMKNILEIDGKLRNKNAKYCFFSKWHYHKRPKNKIPIFKVDLMQ